MGLTLISYSQQASTLVLQQVETLLGDLVSVRSFTYEQLLQEKEPIRDDLILVTAGNRFELLKPFIDPQTKYIIARRIVNPSRIKDLLDMDTDQEVLVVNNQKHNAIAMISELKTMGIELNFVPHDPLESTDKKYEFAVTPGYTSLVPKDIPHVIDVGPRTLSILTIAEIIYHFTGSLDYDGLVFSRYIRDFIDLSREILDQFKENLQLRVQLESVVARFESGILITDSTGRIENANTAAAILLEQEELKGHSITDVLPGLEMDQKVYFLKWRDNTIHVTMELLNPDSNDSSRMYILKDLDAIRELDEQYRYYERSQGYIAKHHFKQIVHSSSVMDTLIEKAKRFARTNSNILIQGESGTGKELFAQAIHNASRRATRPFIAINCAAISETLLESELFGYESGAFTGALKGGKRGLFEQAHTGTLFLDEVGDAPLSIQTKLLRVLQEKEIMRISGEKVIPVDVRIIAATNQNLSNKINDSLFRHDLFYRLNVLPVSIPPLRERKEDIDILLHYFLHQHAKTADVPVPNLSRQVWNILLEHTWPGNIREVVNISEYIVNTSALEHRLEEDLLQMLSPFAAQSGHLPKGTHAGAHLHFSSSRQRDEYLALLDILATHDGTTPMGRKLLQERLANRGFCISEQQVKTRLERLRNAGLIHTVQGRSSTITGDGLAFLRDNVPE